MNRLSAGLAKMFGSGSGYSMSRGPVCGYRMDVEREGFAGEAVYDAVVGVMGEWEGRMALQKRAVEMEEEREERKKAAGARERLYRRGLSERRARREAAKRRGLLTQNAFAWLCRCSSPTVSRYVDPVEVVGRTKFYDPADAVKVPRSRA